MTFSSKSDDFQLPLLGEIWKHIGAHQVRMYVVVVEPRVYAPPGKPPVKQIALLDLESGKVKRVNTFSVNQKQGYQRVRSLKSFGKLSTFGKVSTCPPRRNEPRRSPRSSS